MITTNAEQEQYYLDEQERLRIEYFMDSIAEDLWVDPMEVEEINEDCLWHQKDSFTVNLNGTTPWPTIKGPFSIVCTACEEHFTVQGDD